MVVKTAGTLGALGIGGALLTAALSSWTGNDDPDGNSWLDWIGSFVSTDTWTNLLGTAADAPWAQIATGTSASLAALVGSAILAFKFPTLGKLGLVASAIGFAIQAYNTDGVGTAFRQVAGLQPSYSQKSTADIALTPEQREALAAKMAASMNGGILNARVGDVTTQGTTQHGIVGAEDIAGLEFDPDAPTPDIEDA